MDWKLFVLHNGVHYREDIERSVTNSKIYEYIECVERREQTTEVIVADMKTFDAALKYREGKTCVLNFASFQESWGWVLERHNSSRRISMPELNAVQCAITVHILLREEQVKHQ